MSNCEACLQKARETALENWLDDKGLRTPHPEFKGSFIYDPALVDDEEVESWALSLLDWAPAELGWHELHQEFAA